MRIVEVYANIPIKSIAQSFTYTVPQELHYVSVGWRVLVPFGGRQVEGFVVSAANVSDEYQICDDDGKGIELKNITAVVDDESWFTPNSLKLATSIAEFYLCSPAEIMRLFMPGKSGVKLSACYSAVEGKEDHMLLMVDSYRQLYEELKQEACTLLQLKRRHPDMSAVMEATLEKLSNYGLLEKSYVSQSRVQVKTERIAVLQGYPDEQDLAKLKRSKGQLKLLGYLTAGQYMGKEIPLRHLQNEGFSPLVIKGLAESGWLKLAERRILRDSYKDMSVEQSKGKTLTTEQRNAVECLKADMVLPVEMDKKPFLLHGVTGSGKTLVYMEITKFARSSGKNVIVLVPEIALTGQLVKNFKEYFSGDIVVFHSRLSVAERNDAIVRIRQREAGIIIGARSALFTPVDNIGLIIIDEEQDNSYKQDESPRYHARVVAEMMAEFNHATLVLGSATPSMETFYNAQNGVYNLISMPHRVGNRPMPVVESVDMREELKQGRRTILSGKLQELINDTVSKKEQLILMLNRRGFNTFIMCRSCGYVVACPDCGLPMTYHKDGRLLCHHCDIQAPVPTACPKCGSRYIKFFGSGTEKLETELTALVPTARSIRMDRDTTAGKFAHTDILTKFRRHEYDILLGTQMVAKGHDIPNVTAVGIISADSALHIPYFRAAEQVFMLITQTAGRAGRGEAAGRVIVQTYNPEHYAVVHGMAQDYHSFYASEVKMRKDLFYPPFCRLIKLVFQDKNDKRALEKARQFKNKISARFMQDSMVDTMGPAPAMIQNFRGTYRYCLLIKTAKMQEVHDFLKESKLHLDTTVMIDIDPISTT